MVDYCDSVPELGSAAFAAHLLYEADDFDLRVERLRGEGAGAEAALLSGAAMLLRELARVTLAGAAPVANTLRRSA